MVLQVCADVNLQPRLQLGRGIRIVGTAALASLAWAGAVNAQTPVNKHAAAIAAFNQQVAAYVVLAKTLTEGLPPLKKTDDPTEIAAREVAIGNAIRAGRTGARPGDILTPEVAKVFRRLIKTDFRSRPREGQKVMLDEIPHFHPKIKPRSDCSFWRKSENCYMKAVDSPRRGERQP
jgi:hypothetical protein